MSKLLALAASYRDDSLNRQLLGIAIGMTGQPVTTLDYPSLEAPIYRGEEKVTQFPEPVERFSAALQAHDGIVLAAPEYNWSIPGGLKNIIDWLSVDRRAPLAGKTALLLCASPSARGGITGLQQLRTVLEQLGCWCHPQLVGIGRAQDVLQHGRITNDREAQRLQTTVTDFIRATKALRHA